MSIQLRIERKLSRNIPVGANVLFDTVPLLEGDIAYDIDTGLIKINQAGTFVINWFVGVEATISRDGTVFSLKSSKGDNIIGNNCRKTGEVSGFGIIRVEDPGVAVWLANAAAADIATQPIVPIKAALMLFELIDSSAGPVGLDGMSAYEVAKANGFGGTVDDWLESLVGPKGEPGIQGEPGPVGADGTSAYEAAVTNGFDGTEGEWVDSLVGQKGEPGIQGIPGSAGDPCEPQTFPIVFANGNNPIVLSTDESGNSSKFSAIAFGNASNFSEPFNADLIDSLGDENMAFYITTGKIVRSSGFVFTNLTPGLPGNARFTVISQLYEKTRPDSRYFLPIPGSEVISIPTPLPNLGSTIVGAVYPMEIPLQEMSSVLLVIRMVYSEMGIGAFEVTGKISACITVGDE